MKRSFNFLLLAVIVLLFSCNEGKEQPSAQATTDTAASRKQIAALLDSLNVAAANSEYDRYFSFYTADAIFIGTDATEHWDKKAFMAWAKPAFDKKATWNFSALQRNIYFGKQVDIAWFDELLNTQMKICRGSGVVVKENNEWKLQQYVLSTTVPNSMLDAVIKLKAPEEDSIIRKLQQ